MIRDGFIHYEARKSSFRDWQFDSEVLNVVILAILTTVLSYQLSAICYNIFLGAKVKGRARASDVHKLLLAETSSPLTIIAAVARVDGLDRLRFRGDLPRNVKIARSATKRDETVTFREANFGGIALGVSDQQVAVRSLSESCLQAPLRIVGPAKSLVRFSICFEFELPLDTQDTSEVVRLTAESTYQGQIKVSAMSLPSNTTVSFATLLDLSSDGQLLRTEPVFTQEGAAVLVHSGQAKLAEFCKAAREEISPHNESLLDIEDDNGLLRVSKDFNCEIKKGLVAKFNDIMFDMVHPVTAVERDIINVANVESIGAEANSLPEYFDGQDFPFVTQRSRNVNIMVLLLVLLVSIVVRILTAIFFSNDLDEAVEAIVRYRLGVGPHQSMLTSGRTVRYNSKGQHGPTAHFGLRRSSLREVSQFDTGIEIGMEEPSLVLRSRDQW